MGPEFKFKIGLKSVKLEIGTVIYSRPFTGVTVSPEICNCASVAFKTVEIIPVVVETLYAARPTGTVAVDGLPVYGLVAEVPNVS
jgi:hypothetical protein